VNAVWKLELRVDLVCKIGQKNGSVTVFSFTCRLLIASLIETDTEMAQKEAKTLTVALM